MGENGEQPVLVPPSEDERQKLVNIGMTLRLGPRSARPSGQPDNPALIVEVIYAGRTVVLATLWGQCELRTVATLWLQSFVPFADAADMSEMWCQDYLANGPPDEFSSNGAECYAWMASKGWVAPPPVAWGWTPHAEERVPSEEMPEDPPY